MRHFGEDDPKWRPNHILRTGGVRQPRVPSGWHNPPLPLGMDTRTRPGPRLARWRASEAHTYILGGSMDVAGPLEHTAATRSRWSSLWPAAYLAVTSVALFAAFRQWGYDDPFITYRYADNLRAGLGFVYNPGERVLSTTTPLFTLLLALLGTVWNDLPALANLVGAACLAAGGLCLWDLGRTWRAPAAGWAGLLLYPTFPLLVSTLGSETPLYLALCLGAIAAYARRRYGWVAVLAAAAVLARPDGVLVPVLLGLSFRPDAPRPLALEGDRGVPRHHRSVVDLRLGLFRIAAPGYALRQATPRAHGH